MDFLIEVGVMLCLGKIVLWILDKPGFFKINDLLNVRLSMDKVVCSVLVFINLGIIMIFHKKLTLSIFVLIVIAYEMVVDELPLLSLQLFLPIIIILIMTEL